MSANKYSLLVLFLIYFIKLQFAFSANISSEFSYGLNVYKKGNCMGCHSWHGKGGGGYGAGVSLRNKELSLAEIVNVIKCGRPGTGMPYFYKKSYKDEKCYDTTFEDYDETYRPINSKRFLTIRQIEAVSIFIKELLQDKELTKEYCEFFFNEGSKVCLNINN
tara:strand:+ start:272 stop:760 length:489 start_codon:yes stop_codon:yes gene_type:complete